MKQIWNTNNTGINADVLKYTVGNDYILDEKYFLPYDIKGTLAHAKMLKKMKIFSGQEFKNVTSCLNEISKLWAKGRFKINPEQEDCHTAIEQFMTGKYGEIGQKIHTARSRNDQSLTMIRLYCIDQLKIFENKIGAIISVWNKWIKKNGNVQMPGYTHMQKAMPTTVGTWLDSYIQALTDAIILINSVQNLIDQSPLGSGAGYGIPIEIDRQLTARELGFKGVQENPIYCQLSRGLFEGQVLNCAQYIMQILSRWVSDLLLFTTSEFDYFSLPQEFCTGSSIMPHKKNYDVLELIRANSSVVQVACIEISNIFSKLYLGYNRDSQLMKEPLVRGCSITASTLDIVTLISSKFSINKKKLASSLTSELFSTSKVYENVKKGVPFRLAYGRQKSDNYERK